MKCLHVVNISFVLPYYIGDQFDFFTSKNVKFYVACAPSEFLNQYAQRKNFEAFPVNIKREINLLEDILSIYSLIKIIKANKIDIVIGHTPKGALLAMIASYLTSVKNRIYFRHGLMYETSGGVKRLILKSIEKITGGLATKVICVSPSVLQISRAEKLNSTKKNLILNKGTCNGIDANRFNPDLIPWEKVEALKIKYGIENNEKVIGYVGRLVNDKGINELISAWEILKRKYVNIKLLLVGPFEDRDRLPVNVKDSILNDKTMIYTGLIGDTELYYSMMDIFILPSYREGFPTVVLEAASMKLPVLTTRATGCIDSIQNGVTGIFIDNDPVDIANKINYYLENQPIGKIHGSNGRNFVLENFQQEKIWNEIENVIFSVVK